MLGSCAISLPNLHLRSGARDSSTTSTYSDTSNAEADPIPPPTPHLTNNHSCESSTTKLENRLSFDVFREAADKCQFTRLVEDYKYMGNRNSYVINDNIIKLLLTAI